MKPEKQLYQWDINQYLTELQPTAQFVDYPMGNEVIRIKADGTRCRIPDEVLQTYGGKTCYERYPDGTFRAYSFTVLYAPKPPDYVFTPEERTTFEALTARVDAAIEEIKRRADSGEFTPKKGVDYFTEAEKNELMESVSTGAIGEFRKVVDTATTEYNANAAEKLETYNQNHTEKVAEYNQNATTKTAEFDANADALQTEVDRLRGECDTLAAENRKQENRISAILKLNKGQTYDILPEEGETASRTAPSGAKYVSVDKVGGKSVVWNQLWNYEKTEKEAGVTFTYENHFYDVVKNTTANNGIAVSRNVKSNNKYYLSYEASSNNKIQLNLSLGVSLAAKLTENIKRYHAIVTTGTLTNPRSKMYLYSPSGVTCSYRVGNIKIIDLTAMFGSGNEPSTVEEFEAMFPLDYYEYCEPTIISSQTDRVDVRGKNLFDNRDVTVYLAYLKDNGVDKIPQWFYSDDSKSIRIPCEPNTAYTISLSVESTIFRIGSTPSDLLPLTWGTEVPLTQRLDFPKSKSATITTGESDKYLIVQIGFSTMDIFISEGQIEKGSTATAYSPYSLQQITTNFPVLNSAGSVYDYIDLNEGKLNRRVGVVDLGTLTWETDVSNRFRAQLSGIKNPTTANERQDGLVCARYSPSSSVSLTDMTDKGMLKYNGEIFIKDTAYTDAQTFKTAMSGVQLCYELAEPVITEIDIPTELTDWLTVEAGGTVAFRNADESKQLAVPNAVSWVRKLNEVE